MNETSSPLGTTPPPRSRKIVWWIVFVLVAVNFAILLRVFWPAEPSFRGIPISRWIERSNPTLRHEPVNVFGTNAVPYLLEALERKKSRLNGTAWKFWLKLPASTQKKLVWFKPLDVEACRSAAVNWLLELGPDARAAVPRLIELALHSSNPAIASRAVSLLGVVGANSPGAFAALDQLLKQRDPKTQEAIALSISCFGSKAAEAVPELLQIAQTNANPKAFYAVTALGAIGPAAAPAVPWLATMLNDDDFQDYALGALENIGPAAAPALPQLLPLLEGKHPGLKVRALQVILRLGPAARAAAPQLEKVVRDSEGVPRILAAVALDKIQNQPAAAVVSAELHRTIPTPGKETEMLQPEVFWTIQLPNPVSALPGSFGLGARETASWFLAELGPPAAGALPDLRFELQKGTHWGKVIAARAIWRITNDPAPALPVLREDLFSDEDYEFQMAALVLKEIGDGAKPARPWLEDFVRQTKRPWSRIRQVREILSALGG